METITLEYDIRNKQAKQLIEIILSLGLATRKKLSLEDVTRDIGVKSEKTEVAVMENTVLPFSAGLWADYDIDDRTLRSKAWGTHKRTVQ